MDSENDHALTEKVIGLAMRVHRTHGPGFLESVYQNAFVHELRRVQLVNYLTATQRDFGLLINFGSPSLQFKRKHRRPILDPVDVDLHQIQNPDNPVNPV